MNKIIERPQVDVIDGSSAPLSVYLDDMKDRKDILKGLERFSALLGTDVIGLLHVSVEDLLRLKSLLQVSNGTLIKYMGWVSGYYKIARTLGAITKQDYNSAKLALRVKRTNGIAPGREIPTDELTALFVYLDNQQTIVSIRDACILALAFMGLRRHELAGLTVEQMKDYHSGIVVNGKGDKERIVYLWSTSVTKRVDAWLDTRGDSPGALFVRTDRHGNVYTDEPLHIRTINKVITRTFEGAKIDKVTPHDFRRSGASFLLRKGIDREFIMKQFGWSSDTMLSLYDRRADEERQAALELVDGLEF